MNDNLPHCRHFGRSESIGALAAALAKAQGQIKGAAKDSDNPFFKSKYADLASIRDACAGPLSANGLAVMQFPRLTEGGIEVETLLAHSSGEWVSEVLALPLAKKDAQGVGSAITYGRRYALASITGVAPEDDDGNAAVVTGDRQRAPRKEPSHEEMPDVPADALVQKTLKQIEKIEEWDSIEAAQAFLGKRGFTADQLKLLNPALATRAEILLKHLAAKCEAIEDLERCELAANSFGFSEEARQRVLSVITLRFGSLSEAA